MPPGHRLTARPALTIEDLAASSSSWAPIRTFRRIVVDAFQSAGQVLMTVGQEADLHGLLGLVMAGVGITHPPPVPRLRRRCDRYPPGYHRSAVVIETHLAWRRIANRVATAPLHRGQRGGEQGLPRHLTFAVGCLVFRPVDGGRVARSHVRLSQEPKRGRHDGNWANRKTLILGRTEMDRPLTPGG